MSDEDDFEVDELADDEVVELPEEKLEVTAGGNVPVWRLIEMSRENRFLERELADFDDYDRVDSHSGDTTESYVH
jgi:hypothetical protein